MTHECIVRFETRKIDECSGEGYNRCFGIENMLLDVYTQVQSREEFYDDWIEVEVNFCPYCGLKAERGNVVR